MAYSKGPRGTAERLHAQIVRSRGCCERCGYDGVGLQCAHIVRRSRAGTVTDTDNGWCLCNACHATVDGNAVEFAALVESTLGVDAFLALRRKADDYTRGVYRIRWKDEIVRLKAILKERVADGV